MDFRSRLWLTLTLVPLSVIAQDWSKLPPEEVRALVQGAVTKNTIAISGSMDPGAIPIGERLHALFHKLARQEEALDAVQLRQVTVDSFGASELDHEILLQAANDSSRIYREVAEEEAKSLIELCGQYMDGAIQEGTTVATRFDSISQQRLLSLEDRYMQVINQLSLASRSNLLAAANVGVVSHMTYRTTNHAGLAADLPADLYEDRAKRKCMRVLEWESPSELRDLLISD